MNPHPATALTLRRMGYDPVLAPFRSAARNAARMLWNHDLMVDRPDVRHRARARRAADKRLRAQRFALRKAGRC